MFDILGAAVVGARWLDLYAGSGSLGIEALSRGAAHATFVEAGRAGLRSLEANLAYLELRPPEAIIETRPLPAFLWGSRPDGGPFDFVSLDPPFRVCRQEEPRAALVAGLPNLVDSGWLSPGARLLWEEPDDAPDPVPDGFAEIDRRAYGSARLRIFAAALQGG